MIRSLAVLGVVGGLVIACVTINVPAGQTPTASPTSRPPTATPTVTSAAATPSPSPAPTAPPTPTTPPTPIATQTLGTPPATGPSPSAVANYGATTPLFNDGFDDPQSGWGTGTTEGGSVAYNNGALDIHVTGDGGWEWTRRLAGSTSNAVNAESLWTRMGNGVVGLLCAASDDELWGAAEDAAGNYSFIKVGSGAATILSHGQLDSLKSAADGSSRFALDCAGTATGSFRMQLNAPGSNIGVQYVGAQGEGPANFDRIGIYAQSGADTYNVSVDSVLAFGGTGDTSMSADAVELMTHVPVLWRPNCFESVASVFLVGAKADILCQLDGGKSDWAEYTSFGTQADMDASFTNVANKWAAQETGQNCDTGPHQGTYSIEGQTAGRVLCAPSVTGTQFDWTTNDLLILSSLIDVEGSYPAMYQDWLDAGPN